MKADSGRAKPVLLAKNGLKVMTRLQEDAITYGDVRSMRDYQDREGLWRMAQELAQQSL